jgi:hypothetical protein
MIVVDLFFGSFAFGIRVGEGQGALGSGENTSVGGLVCVCAQVSDNAIDRI